MPRLWRCGNRGNVASVLIEKPVRGDFLPILDGGYSLQYSPLLEYREGRGLVVFCQVDVTGRTRTGSRGRLACSQPAPLRRDLDPGSAPHAPLRRRGPRTRTPGLPRHQRGSYHVDASASNAVLVLGPGGGREIQAANGDVARWIEAGGSLLALGLDQAEARSALGLDITMTRQEYISTSFEPFGVDTLFAGIGPADLHNRDPRDLPLVTGGAQVIGDGVLARVFGRRVRFLSVGAMAVRRPPSS